MRFKTRLVIELDHLEENYSEVKDLIQHQNIIFMVKSDAYGHGMIPIVNYASRELGIKSFGVATIPSVK